MVCSSNLTPIQNDLVATVTELLLKSDLSFQLIVGAPGSGFDIFTNGTTFDVRQFAMYIAAITDLDALQVKPH